jgi:hypothetical protein
MILEAVFDYIAEYTDTAPERIYKGYQNRSALPEVLNDFALIVLASTKRRGTNVDESAVEGSGVLTKSLREYVLQIDFCHADWETARRRAAALETLGRSLHSVEFFKPYNLCYLYADDLQYLPYVDDANQYLHRFRVNIHLSRWEGVQIAEEYFDRANVGKVVEVDTQYPPKQ